MNKKIAQFAFPALLCAFAGAAQAAGPAGPGTQTQTQWDVYFNNSGTSYFNTDPWDVYYVAVAEFPTNVNGATTMPANVEYVGVTYREFTPVEFIYTAGGSFNLDALWLSGLWGTQSLFITGYANGVQVGDAVKVDVSTQASRYTFDTLMGIDKFSVTMGGDYAPTTSGTKAGLGAGSTWVMGGMTISTTATTVPEPETYAMLLAGLGIMGAIARRRQRV
ncbi:MAG: PEP-CTERM sorting domain-containing protein [Betaproteobacteria bacterium]|nr:PEP-CTERM sorting domain-containing protein [Betaproteobacteria bacterium]